MTDHSLPPVPCPLSPISRRQFLQITAAAGAGLTLAVSLQGCGKESPPAAPQGTFAPDAWIRLTSDGALTVLVARSEMGQGISTALPMLVAEELDADWSKVRYEFAPANEVYYNPLLFGQSTGGSTSVRAAWLPLRQAGATARAMLIAAAAQDWGVPPAECETENGEVLHRATARRAGYGSLAGKAALQAVPQGVPLKQPSQFRLIGQPVHRLDLQEKVTGRAGFGIDANPEGALVAVVARCPVFGGKVKSFDASKAKTVPGVRDVVRIDSGIGVVADGYWPAVEGRRALQIEWDEGHLATLDDAEILRRLEALAADSGHVGRKVGEPDAAAPLRTLEAVYLLPYLAHATMEPMNCTADVRRDGVRLWVPTQFQAGPRLVGGGARGVAAKIAGVSPGQVEVHTTHLGGGFGRRFELDFVVEACQVSRAVGKPVKLIWSREDDIQHDHYRPVGYHRLRGGLDAAGNALLWRHHVVCPSIVAKFIPGFIPDWMTHLGGPLKGGVDSNAVEGAVEVPYAIPHLEVTYSQSDLGVPVGFWRSVGHSQNAFAVECFVDELAHLAGEDAAEFRRKLLKDSPRHLGVLDLVVEKAGWGGPIPAGRFRGLALHESFGSWVAQVAEISIEAAGGVKVHRVVCAVDCGTVVNPDTVAAQMESGIVYGLTAALKGRITLEKGRVKQSNFHDYPLLRMSEMPAVEVHLVPSSTPPGGVGEPGTPPIAPAVANALFAATGKRVRSLPLLQ